MRLPFSRNNRHDSPLGMGEPGLNGESNPNEAILDSEYRDIFEKSCAELIQRTVEDGETEAVFMADVLAETTEIDEEFMHEAQPARYAVTVLAAFVTNGGGVGRINVRDRIAHGQYANILFATKGDEKAKIDEPEIKMSTLAQRNQLSNPFDLAAILSKAARSEETGKGHYGWQDEAAFIESAQRHNGIINRLETHMKERLKQTGNRQTTTKFYDTLHTLAGNHLHIVYNPKREKLQRITLEQRTGDWKTESQVFLVASNQQGSFIIKRPKIPINPSNYRDQPNFVIADATINEGTVVMLEEALETIF